MKKNKPNPLSSHKYIYDLDMLILHDSGCSHLDLSNSFSEIDHVDKNNELCPYCERRIYIRRGATDPEYVDDYVKLYNSLDVSTDQLRIMYLDLNMATTLCINHPRRLRNKLDTIQIEYNGETWRIVRICSNKVRLFHNNYYIIDGTRRIVAGFHEQYKGRNNITFARALHVILNYDFNKHSPELINKMEQISKRKRRDSGILLPVVRESFLNKLKKSINVLFSENAPIFPLQPVSRVGYPPDRSICFYSWIDTKGNLRLSAGMYIEENGTFMARFKQQSLLVKEYQVVAWVEWI